MKNYDVDSVSGQVFYKLGHMPEAAEGNTYGAWDPKTFEVEDSAMGFIKMKNGALINLRASWALNYLDAREASTTLCGTLEGAEIKHVYKNQGGGMLYDWGVHLIDQILYMVEGRLETVYADVRNVINKEVDDYFKIILRFENNVTAEIELGTYFLNDKPDWFERHWFVGGDKGSMHVTEYNLCLSSRNILNDSCLKAAYLMNNTIDCLGKAEILGHYLFSDFFTEAEDTGSLIYGGNGFLTKDGIAKPAFFAMEYLHMLYPAVLKKDKNYMITRNSRGSIRLVCHNLKTPNFIYYQAEEDALKIQELQSILSDREFLNIKLKVNGMHNGVYVIKTSVLNSHHGRRGQPIVTGRSRGR